MEKKRSISEISATGSGSQVPVSNASGSFTMTDYDASGLPYDSSYSVKDMIDTIEISLQDLGISKIGISQIGIAGGVASLGNDGKVPSSQLPTLGTAAALDVATSGDASSTQVVKGDDSRLDDVVEGYYNTTDQKFYATLSGTTYSDEITGVISKVYCDKSTNMLYRWTGSAYTIVGGGTQVNADWNASSGVAEILNKPTLGTASALDVATSGDASTTEVVKGDDSRLTDARNAADVYAWAKAATKPTYIPVEVGAIGISQIGIANGVASLDNTGKVPSSQLPSYVDDIIEGYLNSTDGKFYEDSAYTTEITGETGKIYVTKDTNKTYRWSGSAFVEISESLALGETSSTAFAGDRGKAIEDCVPSGASSSNKFATANDIPTVGDAAVKGVDTSISAASTSTNLPTSQAVASFVEGKGYVTTDTNTTYSLSVGTGADADKIVLTPSSGTADTITVPYASDAGTVNGKTVGTNVPSDAVFTDTTYESKTAASGGTDVSLVTTGEKYTWNNKSDFSGAYSDLSGKPTLGTASALDYTTSVTSSSNDLVTSGAVYTAIENLPEPMVFKGSLGSGGTISALPVDGSASVGDTYKVITDGTYDSQVAKIGDLFICLTKTSSTNTWEYIPSADEPSGTVTSVATGVGLTGGPVTSSGTIKANLRSETALTNDSAAATETAGRVYPVAIDNSGYLAVNVPWTDTLPPTAYTSNPEMDGTASAGTSSDYAKGDHVHPSDTTKANQAELAPEFDATRTSSNPYYVGDVVVYNGELYRFVLGHYGAWNASDVVKITVGEQIAAYCTNIIAIPASGWSETATSGYYSQTITTPVYSTTYNPHFSISGASATVLPTDAESAAYRAIQHPNGYIEQVDSTHITVYAKVKPDDTFYVKMAGYGMGLQVEGSDIDPYDSTPEMDGVGSAGVSDDYARGDHVHPSDTSKADKEDILVYGSTWTSKTWGEETENLYGSGVWTDGDNIYLSAGEYQYVLDKSTGTWSEKTWYGLTEFSGSDVWTDGDNIYLSSISDGQYVLDKTTSTWSTKTWNGVSSPLKSAIWTDGENIYMSQGPTAQFILDKSTSTWSTKTWNGYINISGSGIWTDGDNIYYSEYSSNYVLDKATDTWSAKIWTGLTDFTGYYVWTDGKNIYYSEGSTQYILNKSTSTWSSQSWTTLTNFDKDNIWTDGENIYCSKGNSGQYELSKVSSGDIIIEDSIIIKANGDIQGAGEIYDDEGNALSQKFDANSFVLQKFRVTVTASSWSSTATSGYYTYALTLPYPINTYKEFSMGLTGSTDGADPTAAESAAYSLVNYFDASDGTGVTSATLRAKTKPTTTFYIMVSGFYMQKNAATSGVALDIETANSLTLKIGSSVTGGTEVAFDGSTARLLRFSETFVQFSSNNWSNTVDSDGYYTNTASTNPVNTYNKVDVALVASTNRSTTPPTAAKIAAYNLVDIFYMEDGTSITSITAKAKTKPTESFVVRVSGVYIE